MVYDSLAIGYDSGEDGSYIVVMRNQGDKVQMLVGLHDDQADELYKYLTDQKYAMENIPKN